MAVIVGRRPAGNDQGVGHLASGMARGTIVGRVPSHGWVYAFGARVGTSSGSSAGYVQALYEAAGETITTLRGGSEPGTAHGVMDWGGNGSNQEVRAQAPIRVTPSAEYAIAIRSTGNLAHGQDHSGWLMHDRPAATFPNPFAATHVRPEGRGSFWIVYQPNRAPAKPTGLAPANGAFVVTTPTLAGDFRDPDETLPGFGVGEADQVSTYQFDVWDSGRTQRIQTSGRLDASAAQQAARRVTWTPATLPGGSYVARLTVWDAFATPSDPAEWRFTVNAGGATEIVSQPRTTINDTQPNITAIAWDHSGGLSMDRVEVRVVDAAGTVIRVGARDIVLAPGETVGFGYGNFNANALPRGASYRFDSRGRDSTGIWTPWSAGDWFTVNAYPNPPANLNPPHTFVSSSRLALLANFTDPNDHQSTLAPEFWVRPVGDTSDGVPIAGERVWFADDRWRTILSDDEMPAYGVYEWRCRARDPWGLWSAWSNWTTYVYAAPPVVTVTAPANGSTITTGTPGITFSLDKGMQHFRVRIHDRAGMLAYEQDAYTTGTALTHTVAPGWLRNTTTYTATVTVTALDGTVGSGATTFTLDYLEPPALASVTVTTTPGPFEALEPARGWSRLLVSWPEATLEQAPAATFRGYVVRRESLRTGESVILAHLPGRADIAFVDRTCASGDTYRYMVSYLLLENNLDLLESTPVVAEGMVTLVDTVLCSMDAEDVGLPLRFWDTREAELVTTDEVIETWGEKPIVFSGGRQSDVVTGRWHPMDDPNHGGFLAGDLIAAARRLVRRRRDANGYDYPRVVCYRDPRGRVLMTRMHGLREGDRHMAQVSDLDLTFTEIDVAAGITSIEGIM